MQPTYGEILDTARAYLADRAQGQGQIWTNARLKPFAEAAISKALNELQKRSIALGMVEAYIMVPPNQGHLDLRAYGIANVGRIVRVEVRDAEDVPGGPFVASAAEVYGAEPYGAESGGFNQGIPGTGIINEGADEPPVGSHVLIESVSAHGLADGALVAVSPPFVPHYILGRTVPVLEICGQWAVAAYSENRMALMGCRSSIQFDQVPVSISRGLGEFTPVDLRESHKDVLVSGSASRIAEMAYANSTLRWRPVASMMQVFVEYQANGDVPEFLNQTVPINESRHILGELTAGYALKSTPDKSGAALLIASVLGPNMGNPPLGGSLGDLVHVERTQKQIRTPVEPQSYRPRTHNSWF